MGGQETKITIRVYQVVYTGTSQQDILGTFTSYEKAYKFAKEYVSSADQYTEEDGGYLFTYKIEGFNASTIMIRPLEVE